MRLWAIAAAAAMLAMGTAAQADTGFLSIKGQKSGEIKGDVTQKGHEGWNSVVAIDYGISTPTDGASGLATGRRTHQPISFTPVPALGPAARRRVGHRRRGQQRHHPTDQCAHRVAEDHRSQRQRQPDRPGRGDHPLLSEADPYARRWRYHGRGRLDGAVRVLLLPILRWGGVSVADGGGEANERRPLHPFGVRHGPPRPLHASRSEEKLFFPTPSGSSAADRANRRRRRAGPRPWRS
ncbi:MAG: type VI secretion system tube protein Hcp [Asticcacaulis sp.]|nr:type VI secretion system tube protein Hcp [Asticcacaulis sp.]